MSAAPSYALVSGVEEFESLCERLITDARPFGFDIETSYDGEAREGAALHPEENFVTGLSFTNSLAWARYVPLRHDQGANLDNFRCAVAFWKLLATGLGVAHGAKFELRCLSRWFLEFLAGHPELGDLVKATRGYYPIRSCTLLESYVEAANRSHGLKDITKHNFGHQMTELMELFPEKLTKREQKSIRFSELDQHDPKVINYACEDSLWCLAHHLRRYPQVCGTFIYKLEMAVLPVVCQMEDEGLCYDWNHMRDGAHRSRSFLAKLQAEISTKLTEMVQARNPLAPPVNINLGSPAQISKVLYEDLGMKTRRRSRTSGKMSTDKIALKSLSDQFPVVAQILNWKSLKKLLGTYLEKYEQNYTYAPDGRTHPSHIQHGVPAGRFAVAEPPYQQSLDAETEVLTPGGWIRFGDLRDEMPVAQFVAGQDPGDDYLEFVVPSLVNRYDYDGLMVQVGPSPELAGKRASRGESGTWLYTPGHRIVYRRRTARGDRHLSDMREIEAEDYLARLQAQELSSQGRRMHDFRLAKAARRVGGRILTAAERSGLRLAVACQADGHWRRSWYDLEVYKERKRDALTASGLSFRQGQRTRSSPAHRSAFYRFRIERALVAEWLEDGPVKDFRADVILDLCADDLAWFVREVMQWDGDFTRGETYKQAATHLRSVELVQAAAVLSGSPASLYRNLDQDAWTVNIGQGARYKEAGWQQAQLVPAREVLSDGRCYCVTVPSGMFLVRRGGIVQVTGNSPKKYYYQLSTGEEFRYNFREAIIAPAGWYMLGFDYSQIELRVLAGEAGETALIEAFANGVDVHSKTAALMLGKPMEAITPDDRAIGKTMNFALAYQMGVDGLADRLGITKDEAQGLFDTYFAAYPNIKRYLERTVSTAKARGHIVTKFGRVVKIWEFESAERYIYAEGERLAGNAPIQGAGTGDYPKIAMVRADAALRAAGLADSVRLTMNIHDALEFYVRDDVPPAVVIKVLQPAVVFPVEGWPPMVAEWHAGRSWGTLQELEITPEGQLRIKGTTAPEPVAPGTDGDEEDGIVPDVRFSRGIPAPVPGYVPQAPAQPQSPRPVGLGEEWSWVGETEGGVTLEHPDPMPPVSGAEQGRKVLITISELPTEQGFALLTRRLRERPGSSEVVLSTPSGDYPLGRSQLAPEDEAEISLILGGAMVTWGLDSIDHAGLVRDLDL
jgi:DNA polymerase I-like protein with 3'-5' exonuclease and polymerase domains